MDKDTASPGKLRPIGAVGGKRGAILPQKCKACCPGLLPACLSPQTRGLAVFLASICRSSKNKLWISPHTSLGQIQGQLLNTIPPDCARHHQWSRDMGVYRLTTNWLGSPHPSHPTEWADTQRETWAGDVLGEVLQHGH